jgi:hypothetical protein
LSKKLAFVSNNKSSVFLLVLALIVGGVGAQATGLLNTPSGGYLVCVNSKTKVVTHPGTSKCPKGSKRLVLGAQGPTGAIGLTGATGLSGKDGAAGKDGKTLWNGVKDPESTWGAPGDMFINSVTKTLFGPKNLDGTWPVGVSMVGPAGATGPQGPVGATGPQGPSGSGPAGPTGPAGVAAPLTSGVNCIGTKCTYKIGDTGPGGGIIFFVDYHGQYDGLDYLEVAPRGWGNGIATTAGETTGGETLDPNLKWCSNITNLLGPGTWSSSAIGAGVSNTSTADSICTTGAIQAAADYSVSNSRGTFSEWYLPSIGELMVLYLNLRPLGLGDFVVSTSTVTYASSTEVFDTGTSYWTHDWTSGNQNTRSKATVYYVRPIRSF